MSSNPGTPRVLHVHGSLAAGNPQAERCVRLVNAFGGRLRHSMVAADGDFGALAALEKGISVERLGVFPPFQGLPLPGRLQRLAQAMVDYHLVLTYGRAGVGAALAHTSFGEVHALPPLIHHEDGSDETPVQRRGLRSKWLRRLGLGKAVGLVVPTETMEAAALVDWQQPLGRVKLIRDGVDIDGLGKAPRPAGIGRLLKRDNEHWVGCFPRDGESESIAGLVKVLAGLDDTWHLVVAGERAPTRAVEAAITALALEHRVHFVADAADARAALELFDIVAAPGDREPLPLTAIQAMAMAKPVVGLAPGEAAAALSSENAGLGGDALARLADEAELRHAAGVANREKAKAERGAAAMIAAYRRLYASAMKRDAI